MKRDQRLRGLSDEHHAALVIARSAGRAADGDRKKAHAAWDKIVRWFASELEPHFRVEERYLLPALEALGKTELVSRTRTEHDALRACIARTGEDVQQRLREFSDALVAHVRFEERMLFETVQRVLDAATLEAVAAARVAW